MDGEHKDLERGTAFTCAPLNHWRTRGTEHDSHSCTTPCQNICGCLFCPRAFGQGSRSEKLNAIAERYGHLKSS